MNHLDHMRHALTLAERALGQAAPNPAVGCVIVGVHGQIVGRGHTGRGGRPHAETVSLAQAGGAARGATAYVTLEPCAHTGQTPPCAEALITSGVKRVVCALEDPDPRVKGRGFAMLRRAGVTVEVGVGEQEAAFLNAGFFLRLAKDRPLVSIKIAQSQDGKTIPPPHMDRWITSEAARRFAHLLRARHGAILVGIETVLADDPELTCRLPGLENRSPMRVVLDSRLRMPAETKLVRTARETPTLVFTTADGGDRLRACGVEVLRVLPDPSGRPALSAVLGVLAQRGCTRLLVEGGAGVWSSFLAAGLADRLEVFTTPVSLGNEAAGSIPELAHLDSFPRFVSIGRRALGPDWLESYAATA